MYQKLKIAQHSPYITFLRYTIRNHRLYKGGGNKGIYGARKERLPGEEDKHLIEGIRLGLGQLLGRVEIQVEIKMDPQKAIVDTEVNT